MRIHENFPGGNIEIAKIIGNQVWLRPALRDTSARWFYWAFCVEGAAGSTITFEFDESWLGYFGPAVSRDLETWTWAGAETLIKERKGFTFTFGEAEDKVYFAHHLLYPSRRFDRLLARFGKPVQTLTTSNGGRAVPMLHIEGERMILLTARHHCCESTGSYVLEGATERLLESLPAGFGLCVVPFVDYDGVLQGDQGKARIPHDHNRDYADPPLYAETKALMALGKAEKFTYAFDFHAPWHIGNGDDQVFLVKNLCNPAGQTKFSKLFAETSAHLPFPYDGNHDTEPNVGWNIPVSTMMAVHFGSYAEAELSLTLEVAYFGIPGRPNSQENLVALGKGFGEALCRYIQTLD